MTRASDTFGHRLAGQKRERGRKSLCDRMFRRRPAGKEKKGARRFLNSSIDRFFSLRRRGTEQQGNIVCSVPLSLRASVPKRNDVCPRTAPGIRAFRRKSLCDRMFRTCLAGKEKRTPGDF